ncbi:hypothetical protein FI667_g10517, partial [Globisporangium splendens]
MGGFLSSRTRHHCHHACERDKTRAGAHLVQISPPHEHLLHPCRSSRAAQFRIDELAIEREHLDSRERRDGKHEAAAEEPHARQAAASHPIALQEVHGQRADAAAERHGTVHARGVEVHAPEERRLERELVGLEQRRVLRRRDKRGSAGEDPREPRGDDFREHFRGHDTHLCDVVTPQLLLLGETLMGMRARHSENASFEDSTRHHAENGDDWEENGAFGGVTTHSSLDGYHPQQHQLPLSGSNTHTTSTRRMSRLRAEAMIAAAQRIPAYHQRSSNTRHSDAKADSNACDATATSSVNRGTGATVTHEFYLQQSGLQFFMEDLIKKLQEHRPENSGAFIANYSNSVTRGTHVSGRTFEFINGTMQSRLAFPSQLQETFANVDMHMCLTLDDFMELIWCQCRDFPSQLLQQMAQHLKEGDDGHVRTTLRAFFSAFTVCFFYNEFLTRTYDIYGEMQASTDGRVASPRSNSVRSESIANAMAADRVVARLRVVAQQHAFSIPPMREIEVVVYKSTSFKEFCARFYESPVVAGAIQDLQSAFQTLANNGAM